VADEPANAPLSHPFGTPASPGAGRRARRLLFGTGVALLAVVGGLSLSSLDRAAEDAALVSHTREVLGRITRIRLLLDAAENGRLGYVLTNDRSERDRYERSRSGIVPVVGEVARLTTDNPDQQRDLRILPKRIAEWSAALEASIADFERNGFQGASQAAFTDRVRAGESAMRDVLDRMEGRENALLDERRRGERESADRTRVAILSAFGFGILLLAAAALSAARDFAARLDAERALREREEIFRLLVQGVEEYAIFLLDPSGRVVTWTEGARRLKGYTAEEAVGLPHAAFYPPEAVEEGRPAALLETALREGRAEDEGWRVRKDGSGFWADVVITPIRADGRLLGFAKVTRDMTEKREAARRIEELNEDLRRRAAELAAANEELESFSYSVSHDLRAPLRSIDGFGQALLEDAGPALSDAARRDLDRIRAAARRMGELIDALLDLSRVGRRPLRRETVDLSSLASAIADELRRTEPGRRVEFEIAENVRGEGDETLLRLVLQNLIANAWKFTAGREPARIAFGIGEDGAYYVRDNGAGFDMAYAGHLFAPFHRLHGAAEFPGTGIGLATVDRIVRRHAGRVWADGEVGKGATFHFTL